MGTKTKTKTTAKIQTSSSSTNQAEAMMYELTKVLQDDKDEGGVLGKIQTGLASVIPLKFNITDDDTPVLMNEQQETGESLQNRHDLDFEEYCNIKQGYISVVKSNEKSDKMKKQVLRLKPVFAVLNKETLSLFENENVKSLYRSYNMRFIKPNNVPKKWESINCWQVVRGVKKANSEGGDDKEKDKEEKVGETEEGGEEIDNDKIIVDLCASDHSEMEGWMNAIKDFHNCDIKEGEVQKQTGQTDPNNNSQDEVIEMEREAKDQEDIVQIDDALNSVDDIVEDAMGKIRIQKLKHKKEVDQEENKIEDMEDKEKCLTEKLIDEAKKADLALLADNKLNELLKDFKKPVEDQMKDRMDRIIQHEQEQITTEHKLENNLRDMMTKQTEDFTKQYDASSCYSIDIVQKGNKEIKAVCSQIFRPLASLQVKDLMLCLNPETFCRACCNGFIGPLFEDRRMSCGDKCDAALKSYKDNSELNMSVFTDNGVTNHEFVYGTHKEDVDKLRKEAQKNFKKNY